MYRSVVSPPQAMQQLLSSIQARLNLLERRTRWPGAVQLVREASPPNPTGNSIGTGSYTDVISLTLDPGRWIFHAGVQAQLVISLGTEYQYSIQLDFPDLPTAITGGSGGGLNPDFGHLALSYSATLDAQTTVTMKQRFNLASTGSCTPTNAYLIAVPG